jgi:hypothetical protein
VTSFIALIYMVGFIIMGVAGGYNFGKRTASPEERWLIAASAVLWPLVLAVSACMVIGESLRSDS